MTLSHLRRNGVVTICYQKVISYLKQTLIRKITKSPKISFFYHNNDHVLPLARPNLVELSSRERQNTLLIHTNDWKSAVAELHMRKSEASLVPGGLFVGDSGRWSSWEGRSLGYIVHIIYKSRVSTWRQKTKKKHCVTNTHQWNKSRNTTEG